MKKLFYLLLLAPVFVRAQHYGAEARARNQDRNNDKLPVKFGKVAPEDFAINTAGLDTSAGAVVVADYGTSEFQVKPRGGLLIIYKHNCRIKILKRMAFGAATITIPLFGNSRESEELQDLRASTYNLENGKVVEAGVDDKSVFTEKLNREFVERKFTFPNVKEGSIIEYAYTETSPFLFNLQPWTFQREYPCLWSEYQAGIPNFLIYVTMTQGFIPFTINSSDTHMQNFILDGNRRLSDDVVNHRWVIKNVPALKQEPFTTTLSNYFCRIEFQLTGYNFHDGVTRDLVGNWSALSEKLLQRDDFGGELYRDNGWLDDELKTITGGAAGELEKAQKIFAFVRDNFTCTSHNSVSMIDPIKTVYKNRHGSESELNLLLTAMLFHEKIKAEPVILSTRDHGYAVDIYPLLSRFNYVITRIAIGSAWYYLDASEPWLGFGRLPGRCYNGNARVINEDGSAFVTLDADSLKENKMTVVFINKDGKGVCSGHLQSSPGFLESCRDREKLRSSGPEDFFKPVKTAFTGEYAVSGLEIDSLQRPDDPLALAYDFTIRPDSNAALFYFNPMLGERYGENPFKAETRLYPVEMPSLTDEVYTLTMDVPDGYVVDELPKQEKVLLNTDEGFFEYVIDSSDDTIRFRSRIKLNKANFTPEDYATLRDFFAFIVKKQSEQIVFKKKKSA